MRPRALKVREQLGNFAVGQDSGFTVQHVRLVDPLLNRLHCRHNPSLTGLSKGCPSLGRNWPGLNQPTTPRNLTKAGYWGIVEGLDSSKGLNIASTAWRA